MYLIFKVFGSPIKDSELLFEFRNFTGTVVYLLLLFCPTNANSCRVFDIAFFIMLGCVLKIYLFWKNYLFSTFLYNFNIYIYNWPRSIAQLECYLDLDSYSSSVICVVIQKQVKTDHEYINDKSGRGREERQQRKQNEHSKTWHFIKIWS